MVKVIKPIFVTLLFIVGITFSMQNAEPLKLKYYFGLETPEIPLFLLVLVSILVGVLLAGMSFIVDQWSFRKSLREKERRIASLEKELKEYREQARTTP
jgi:putative membrane protein